MRLYLLVHSFACRFVALFYHKHTWKECDPFPCGEWWGSSIKWSTAEEEEGVGEARGSRKEWPGPAPA